MLNIIRVKVLDIATTENQSKLKNRECATARSRPG